MLDRYFFTGFFIITCSIFLSNLNAKLSVKIQNLECLPNPDWVNISCKLKAVNWKKTLINVDAELKEDTKKALVNVQVYKRYNTYQPIPLAVSFEFCSFMLPSRQNYFFTPFVNELIIKYTNINHTCPYKKGSILLARNFDFIPADFLDISVGAIGAGRYRLDVNIFPNGLAKRGLLIKGYGDVSDV